VQVAWESGESGREKRDARREDEREERTANEAVRETSEGDVKSLTVSPTPSNSTSACAGSGEACGVLHERRRGGPSRRIHSRQRCRQPVPSRAGMTTAPFIRLPLLTTRRSVQGCWSVVCAGVRGGRGHARAQPAAGHRAVVGCVPR
jgi:hypothetical protein